MKSNENIWPGRYSGFFKMYFVITLPPFLATITQIYEVLKLRELGAYLFV
jgi:hypothetical protein